MKKFLGNGAVMHKIFVAFFDYNSYNTCLWYQALKNGVNSLQKSCCRNAAAFYKLYFMV